MRHFLLLTAFLYVISSSLAEPTPGSGTKSRSPILVIDGRNNHDWEVTTDALVATLEATGRFVVTVETAPELPVHRAPRKPRTEVAAELKRYEQARARHSAVTSAARAEFSGRWENWKPEFAKYGAVLLNYNGPTWPQAMRESFVDYVRGGGGVVLVHAANNAFGNWEEFNQMIGMGWRKKMFGKALKIDPESGDTFWDKTAGDSGHGSKHPFQVTVRAADHPIMKSLPRVWMHAKDELYHDMRGLAQNVKILSSAFSDPKQRGTGKHEPITWEVGFGEGRVIVTTMGHFWTGQSDWDALYCVGFQTVLARSCEYAATGKVTLGWTAQFPAADAVSVIAPHRTNFPRTTRGSIDSREFGNAFEREWLAKEKSPYLPISPGAQKEHTFEVADGYEIDLVAAEPDVQEPVLTVWDGNGVMYVAEMRSYMQDENGTGTKELKNGRIKRLEDTTGDGSLDKVTVFVDALNLPRAILPLDGRIAVRESDSTKVIAYRDTTGDGIADQREVLFEGKNTGRNGLGTSVEHQDSGLIWNLDNWIYVSYNEERYRYTDGRWIAERQPSHWTQWGLDRDDTGRLFWIANSQPLLGAQLHPKYWKTVRRLAKNGFAGLPVDLGDPYNADFMQAHSSCLLNDRGGKAAAIRGFTSACGQSVFRGDRLPFDARGDYFFVDPTIHVMRRAKIADPDGMVYLEKATPDGEEFLRSSDINCRFVNTATAPDGTLYVTDMYRGIIQDAPWMNPQAREFTKESGLAKNTQRGRIWRVRHSDHRPGKQPRMLDESTVELLRHLEHPNGWWRDTAQRLIVLRRDRKSVVPLLQDMLRYQENALARLHALWTLEGAGAIDRDSLFVGLNDRDWRVRAAAVHISESMLPEMIDELVKVAGDKEAEVAKQLIFTLGLSDDPKAIDAIQTAARRHLKHKGVILATTVSLWGMSDLPLIEELTASDKPEALNWKTALANWNRGLKFPKEMPKEEKKRISNGETLFFKHCTSCHGADGKGIAVPGTNLFMAPSLVGSKRVNGDPKKLVPVLLHGLMGPIDGKTYQAGYMVPLSAFGLTRDNHVAELASFLRYAWGHERPGVTPDEAKTIRESFKDREMPWTELELDAMKD